MLIATERDTQRYDALGREIALYAIPGGDGIALTPDGLGVWYSAGPEVRRVGFAAPEVIVARSAPNGFGAEVMGVVGEWHGALQQLPPVRRRSTRH